MPRAASELDHQPPSKIKTCGTYLLRGCGFLVVCDVVWLSVAKVQITVSHSPKPKKSDEGGN